MSRAKQKRAPGAISLATQLSTASCTETSTPTLHGIVVLSPSFPARGATPRPLLFSPATSPKLQDQPPISADPDGREPGIQLLFPGERHPFVWRRRASEGREAAGAKPPPPPPSLLLRLPRAGRGKAGPGPARDAASGTICPSARRAAAPASSGLSGRLAEGFPLRAPPAIGAAPARPRVAHTHSP